MNLVPGGRDLICAKYTVLVGAGKRIADEVALFWVTDGAGQLLPDLLQLTAYQWQEWRSPMSLPSWWV